jgi:chromosome partitioning protein
MIRLVVSNQRGGVAKTTTTHSLARYCADRGLRVLIVDTDPQGSIGAVLGLKPPTYLHQFIVQQLRLKDCVVKAHPRIDVLCSNRDSLETEALLMGRTGREMTFVLLFQRIDEEYDVVLVDVAPSISLLQTCAAIYAEQLLIPVAMDPLSLQGAVAALETAKTLNPLFRVNIRPVGLLPVQVDRRLGITDVVFGAMDALAEQFGAPVLPAIRTDSTVTKAARAKQFLMDFDAKCKACEDYTAAFDQLFSTVLKGQLNGKQLAFETTP